MVEVLLATKKGIRKTRVSEDKLKKYGRLSYKNKTVYAPKVKVALKTKTVLKAVDPKKLERNYTYLDEKKVYKRYEPNRITQINTKDGNRFLSEEQKKLLYTKEGDIYVRSRALAKVRDRTRKSEQSDKLPTSTQLAVRFKVKTQDDKVHIVRGYSTLNKFPRPKSELRNEAYISMRVRLHDLGYDYDESVEVISSTTSYLRWVN